MSQHVAVVVRDAEREGVGGQHVRAAMTHICHVTEWKILELLLYKRLLLRILMKSSSVWFFSIVNNFKKHDIMIR